ncbi:hypothetical protein BU15DRAFT_69466 [Melanogaster broomeanus]|nr:hypothetical protein BU15DRAFT_69466 [Melanogaster broomeanus]
MIGWHTLRARTGHAVGGRHRSRVDAQHSLNEEQSCRRTGEEWPVPGPRTEQMGGEEGWEAGKGMLVGRGKVVALLRAEAFMSTDGGDAGMGLYRQDGGDAGTPCLEGMPTWVLWGCRDGDGDGGCVTGMGGDAGMVAVRWGWGWWQCDGDGWRCRDERLGLEGMGMVAVRRGWGWWQCDGDGWRCRDESPGLEGNVTDANTENPTRRKDFGDVGMVAVQRGWWQCRDWGWGWGWWQCDRDGWRCRDERLGLEGMGMVVVRRGWGWWQCDGDGWRCRDESPGLEGNVTDANTENPKRRKDFGDAGMVAVQWGWWQYRDQGWGWWRCGRDGGNAGMARDANTWRPKKGNAGVGMGMVSTDTNTR